ncbi:16S rRNA (adenine(1518)-N(6)/adenine(1519)-N(6))-dimethyltransferase RsmA [Chloroflexota bacterium]
MAKEVTLSRHYPESGSLLAQTKRLLRRFELQARKSLGQHFLIDRDVLKSIVSTAELSSTDTVVEIGPGLGMLTRELEGKAGLVIAVEVDSKLSALLRETLASSENVVIINRDILKIEPESLLQEQKAVSLPEAISPFSYKVVANLPYYITSPVMRQFLEAKVKPEIMVVMVQKEVAKAIAAEPGKMSLLSVSVQFYGKPKIIRYVPAQCFYPAPEVDSAILRVDLYPQPPIAVTDERSFFELVRAGFSAPRKQIVNSLTQGLKWPKAEVLSLLEKAGIMPQRRAEALTLDDWVLLWQVFTRERKSAC